ncbi:esterase E4-like [Pieris brassicae]|uniref:esterase E4-like n=1 Tax=Pieris brassicae TaxID=7116 RepID=UPI001E660164|nr:esterase E4-like [Pieris brassicae]
MWSLIFLFIFSVSAEDSKTVELDSGWVVGKKYWNGDYYEFYGIPYATVPTGRDRFKAPLPVTPWENVLSASDTNKRCKQCYYTDASDEDVVLDGDEDCLVINVITPTIASETNPVPVIVYIHSGAFSGGTGNMAKFTYLARHDVVVVSFNYRVGAIGFACLGNEDIPGNAALKDQVAALRWIKKNIHKFGGNPNKITLAGFSVGASMAELLALSKASDGLINRLILESGSALAPFTINRDPVSTAWNIAQAIGYNGTANIDELTEFYLTANMKDLALKSLNYFLPNSTFGFAPCIEKDQGLERIVTESPLDTLKKGDFKKIPVLTGFSNMEGLSRSIKFGSWREKMNENFSDFLPADLKFKTEDEKNELIKEIKKYYFNDKVINHESLKNYIDYFSDIMFKYSIMKSAQLHSSLSTNPVYLYEFSYVGKLNIQHNYMDRIKGASHRDQTAYILDFYGFTNNYKDLTTRDRMTTMWTDFAQYGNPTEYESALLSVKWPSYTKQSPMYLEINKNLQVKKGLFTKGFQFWDQIYSKYHWDPQPVNPEIILPREEIKSAALKTKTKKQSQPTLKENKNDKTEKQVISDNIDNTTDNLSKGKSKDKEENKIDKQPTLKSTTTKIKRGKDGKLVKEVITKTNQNTERVEAETKAAKDINENPQNDKLKSDDNTSRENRIENQSTLKKTTTKTKRGKDGKLVKKVITETYQNDKKVETVTKDTKDPPVKQSPQNE